MATLHDLDQAQQLAADGWLAYIRVTTKTLSPTADVADRLAQADLPADLPKWLTDGIWIALVAERGQALVERCLARAGTAG